MPAFIVSYDLMQTKDYSRLTRALEGHRGERCLLSTWLVYFDGTGEDLARQLRKAIDADDKLIVAVVDAAPTGIGLDPKVQDWITVFVKGKPLG